MIGEGATRQAFGGHEDKTERESPADDDQYRAAQLLTPEHHP